MYHTSEEQRRVLEAMHIELASASAMGLARDLWRGTVEDAKFLNHVERILGEHAENRNRNAAKITEICEKLNWGGEHEQGEDFPLLYRLSLML